MRREPQVSGGSALADVCSYRLEDSVIGRFADLCPCRGYASKNGVIARIDRLGERSRVLTNLRAYLRR